LNYRYKAKIALTNAYTDESEIVSTGIFSCAEGGVRFSARLSDMSSGVIFAEITEFKASLCVPFIGKKIKCRARDSVLLMPEPDLDCAQLYAFSADENYAKKSASGMADGAREYRLGDSFGDIHMKLSAKVGRYMVRERFGSGEGVCRIAFTRAVDREIAEKNASILFGLVSKLLLSGYECRVLCGEKTAAASTPDDVEGCFYDVFTARLPLSCEQRADCIIADGEVRAT
jgi:hypothetical protein